MKADAVFEGGGIKGIAFLGAVEVMEKAGYRWERLAGVSAGSIIASMLATGMSAKEIAPFILSFPFHELESGSGIGKIPYVGPILCMRLYNGMYSLNILEQRLNSLFASIGKRTFGDLPDGKLKIVVTDITRNKMTILPDDLPSYGLNPATFPLATAVRMSCTVPFIFQPMMIKNNIIVDGAVLSNYPIWLFDTKTNPKWPTFGFRLSGAPLLSQPKEIKGPIRLAIALIRTIFEGQDQACIDAHNAARTILIKGIPFGSTDFSINDRQKDELVQLGRDAAVDFLVHWNFQQYLSAYRK